MVVAPVSLFNHVHAGEYAMHSSLLIALPVASLIAVALPVHLEAPIPVRRSPEKSTVREVRPKLANGKPVEPDKLIRYETIEYRESGRLHSVRYKHRSNGKTHNHIVTNAARGLLDDYLDAGGMYTYGLPVGPPRIRVSSVGDTIWVCQEFGSFELWKTRDAGWRLLTVPRVFTEERRRRSWDGRADKPIGLRLGAPLSDTTVSGSVTFQSFEHGIIARGFGEAQTMFEPLSAAYEDAIRRGLELGSPRAPFVSTRAEHPFAQHIYTVGGWLSLVGNKAACEDVARFEWLRAGNEPYNHCRWPSVHNAENAGPNKNSPHNVLARLDEGFRSLELDCNNAHEWKVYHLNDSLDSRPLSHWLSAVTVWQDTSAAADTADVITLWLDIWQDWDKDGANAPIVLDRMLVDAFGSRLFSPDSLVSFAASSLGGVPVSLQDAVRRSGWPSRSQLKGRVIVVLTGMEPRLRAYAGNGGRGRAAFVAPKIGRGAQGAVRCDGGTVFYNYSMDAGDWADWVYSAWVNGWVTRVYDAKRSCRLWGRAVRSYANHVATDMGLGDILACEDGGDVGRMSRDMAANDFRLIKDPDGPMRTIKRGPPDESVDWSDWKWPGMPWVPK
jgi:hypothetical protein